MGVIKKDFDIEKLLFFFSLNLLVFRFNLYLDLYIVCDDDVGGFYIGAEACIRVEGNFENFENIYTIILIFSKFSLQK